MPAERGQNGAPTLRTVAERAGVSKSLVSLVMNGSPHVSDRRRVAVMNAAREVGYRPNAMARSLVAGRTRTVGVVISDIENPWWVEVARGLEETFRQPRLRLLLADPQVEPSVSDELVDAFLELRVDGLILVGAQPMTESMKAATNVVPTVFASFVAPGIRRVDCVAGDDEVGIALAVDHLADLGHRRILHVGGSNHQTAVARRAGYESAMRRRGLGAEIQVAYAEPNDQSGYDAAMRLLVSSNRPTAIVAFNDVVAIGVLSAADELGIAVPDQLSLTGYDNTRLSAIRHLSLTTVDPNSNEQGRIAATYLLERLERPTRRARESLVEPRLVVRSSTARPSKGAGRRPSRPRGGRV
jgi:DNA-binding LacI/PurR family transcriptional regulator